jgi:transketolase
MTAMPTPIALHTPLSLRRTALQIRRRFLQMHYDNHAGHIGTGLSAIDLLTFVYSHGLGDGGQFILSKGHGASALYATLHAFGLLSTAMLSTYYQDGTLLPAHPAPLAHPHIPLATGSLGHGLPVAVGMAYASAKIAECPKQVFCMVSDGECNEGSIWEAALFAGHHRLHNLTVMVDANGLQGFGRTCEVLDLEPLTTKWQAFGFATQEIDGHDFAAMQQAFAQNSEKPRCLVARTTKGKGVSFMEDRLAWHYLPMQAEHFSLAMAELDAAEEALSHAR